MTNIQGELGAVSSVLPPVRSNDDTKKQQEVVIQGTKEQNAGDGFTKLETADAVKAPKTTNPFGSLTHKKELSKSIEENLIALRKDPEARAALMASLLLS